MIRLQFCVLCLICIKSINGNTAPYYGVPIGPLFNAAQNTQGDVYVSDQKTLTVAHFSHKGQSGCSAFVVGPANAKYRLGGEKEQFDGMILPFRKHVENDVERSKRNARDNNLVPRISALNPNFHPFDWPFDFGGARADDPIKADADEKSPSKNQFKIELDISDSTKTPITPPSDTPTPEILSTTGSTTKTVTRIRTVPVEQKTVSVTPLTDIQAPTDSGLPSSVPADQGSTAGPKATPKIALSLDGQVTSSSDSPVADAFVEELSLDDLKGTGAAKKWTLPGGFKIVTDDPSIASNSAGPSKKPRRRQSVVLHAPAPIILDERKNGRSNESTLNSTPYVNIQTKSGPKIVSKDGGHRNRSSRSPRKPRAAEAEGANVTSPISLDLTTENSAYNETTVASSSSTSTAPLLANSETPAGHELSTSVQNIITDTRATTLQSPEAAAATQQSVESATVQEVTEFIQSASFADSSAPAAATLVYNSTEPIDQNGLNLEATEFNETAAVLSETKDDLSDDTPQERSETTVASPPVRPANRTFAQRKTTTAVPVRSAPRKNTLKEVKIDENLPSAVERKVWHQGAEKKVPRQQVDQENRFYEVVTDRVPKKSQHRKQQVQRPDQEENLDRYSSPRKVNNVDQPYNREAPKLISGGGIVWGDYTLSPAAKRRSEDIRNSEYRFGGPNENDPDRQRTGGSSFNVASSPKKNRTPPPPPPPRTSRYENEGGDNRPNSAVGGEPPAGPSPPGARDYKAERYDALRRAGRLDNFFEPVPTPLIPSASNDDYKSNLLLAVHQAERGLDDQPSGSATAPTSGSRPKYSANNNANVPQPTEADDDIPTSPTTVDYRAERYDALRKAGLLNEKTLRATRSTQKPPEAPPSRNWFVVDERPSNKKSANRKQRRNEIGPDNMVQVKTAARNEKEVSGISSIDKHDSDKIVWDFNEELYNSRLVSSDAEDSLVTVTLADRYSLTDFQWFGLYDTCQKEFLSKISLTDIEYPNIAEIAGFEKKQTDGIKSGKIYIVNCNTLYISNFTYNIAAKTDGFLYVGSGDFPVNIVKKEKAHVLGYPELNPLRAYSGENLYVKLPVMTKTFDINWIAVFDEQNNKFLASATIPPVIVPPCDY